MGHVETPVLVVGGSLVGLSTSLFLAHHGVEHLRGASCSGSSRTSTKAWSG